MSHFEGTYVFVSVEQLTELIEAAVEKKLKELLPKQDGEKLLSPSEARKVFVPAVSLVTLEKWAKEGKIAKHYMGKKVLYKQSELIEAAKALKPYNKL